MAKPYSIFKTSNGIYYVNFPADETHKPIQRSTGSRNRREAENIVLSWYKDGSLPKRINAKDSTVKTTLNKVNLLSTLRSIDLTKEDTNKIIKILKDRELIVNAILPSETESLNAKDFLKTFWEFDESPYVKEKTIRGQSIHRSYCETMKCRVHKYWFPKVGNKAIGEINRNDIKSIFNDESVQKLSKKTINGILDSLRLPLKWAHNNELTKNTCYEGIIKCNNTSKKRAILSPEQAMAVFNTE